MSILTTLAVNSVIFSILFGLILLVRKFFSKKMSITCQYLLWAIVLLKLLLPFGFEAAILPAYTPAPQQQVQQDFERPISNNTQVAQTVNEEAALSVAEETFDNTPIQPVQPSAAPIHWSAYLLAAWMAGMALMSAFLLWYHRQIHRRLRHNSAVVGSQVLETAKLCMRELGIHRRIHICMQKKVEVPAISGLLRTTLILPASLNEADRETIYNVCLHELLHYKSGDLYLIAFLNIINILYWFHPLVWRAISLIRDDMESMCDKRVLARTQSRDNYVSTILEFATGKSNHRLKAALSMAGGGRVSMEERIRNMFRNKKMKTGSRAAVGLLAMLMLGTSLLTACKPVGAGAASATDLEQIEMSQTLQQELQLPERYQDSYSLNDKTNVVFDAELLWPEADQLISADAKPEAIDQNKVDTVIHSLFGKTQLYKYHSSSKEMIQANINRTQEWIDELRNSPEPEINDQNQISTADMIKKLEREIASEKERLETATDTATGKETTSEMKTREFEPNMEAEELRVALKDKDRTMVVDVFSFSDGNAEMTIGEECQPEQSNGHFLKEYQIFDKGKQAPTNTKLNKAQAQKKAVEAIGQISPEMKLAYTGVAYYGNPYDDDNHVWACVFTREVEGVQENYSCRDHGDRLEVDMSCRYYEKIMVCYDDDGLAFFKWQNPNAISNMQPVQGLNFEQIKAAAKEELLQMIKDYNFGPQGSKLTFEFNQAKLGLMRVTQSDGSYRLTPVWDFYGSVETMDERMSEDDRAEAKRWAQQQRESKRYVWLTLDATTGKRLERALGK